MENPEGCDAEEASKLSELVAKGLLDFLNPEDRGIFDFKGSTSETHTSNERANGSSADLPSEATLLMKQLAATPFDDHVAVRRRIEELTELSMSLDKQLTHRTESRHKDLMETSKRLIAESSMKKLCEETFPRLRSAFDSYVRSSLHNVLLLPKLFAKKSDLKRLSGMLNHLNRIGEYCDVIREYKDCNRYRILAGAAALHHIDLFTHDYPEASRLTVLRHMRDSLINRIYTLVKNAFLKVDAGLNFRPTVQLFHLLGISAETTAYRVLHNYRRHIFGIALSTLQRYAHLDSGAAQPTTPYGDCGETSPKSSSCNSDLAHYTRLVGSNMVILTICKTLSEFTTFLESAASELSKEPPPTSRSSRALTESLAVIKPYIKEIDEGALGTYMDSVLTVVRREFDSLRCYACELLSTMLCEMSIHGVKDSNDYLKIGLLLRFFLLSQYECVSLRDDVPTTHATDYLISTRLRKDLTAFDADSDIDGVKRILHAQGDAFLSFLPEETFSYTFREVSKQLEHLEQTLHKRVILPYVELFHQETIEKLYMSLEGDSSERLPAPVGFVYEHCDVFGLCNTLISRVKENVRSYGDIRVCHLNPYNGWTPSSAFLGVCIEKWHSNTSGSQEYDFSHKRETSYDSQSYGHSTDSRTSAEKTGPLRQEDSVSTSATKDSFKDRNKPQGSTQLGCRVVPKVATQNKEPYQDHRTPTVYPSNAPSTKSGNTRATHQQSGKTPIFVENMFGTAPRQVEADALTQDERAYLYRNYGCVFTPASFTLWSQLKALFNVLVLQPKWAYVHVKRLMSAFDWLVLRSIRTCQMSPDLGDLPHLRDFLTSQADISTGDIVGPEKHGKLSMLATLVNRVESVAILLELLRRCLEFTCPKCVSVVLEYYSTRVSVVNELRVGVYPMCMLSLLQKRLPGDHIIQLLKLRHASIPQLSRDVSELLSALTGHIQNVQEFIEAADCGSIPMPVKLMLWRYACLVLKSTMRALYEGLANTPAPQQIVTVVRNGYQQAVDHCSGIYETYLRDARNESRRYGGVIKRLAVYETVMQEMFTSRT
ncbi:hypothetical protein BgAZ_100460 [Babesia gibsoni]|uniref:Uncharacterized protein n=1 Tax=Babesia gibsoni TaxID=33632 RepID=A0AAD8PF53_BABGI|nr:hypothetical protein BgAZ_100460 [Babesia gibsoni]